MRRIEELEGLRGILAWWVVAGHVLFSFSDQLGRLSHNRSAVDVFIIMSGLVIMFLLDDRKEAPGPFILRRFFRLFPAYFVVLLASTALMGLTAEALADAPSIRNAERLVYLEAANANLLGHFAAHLAMLHGLVPSAILPHADHSLVGPAWSISVEWQFYLIAPLVYMGLTSGWAGRAAVLIGAAGLYASSFLPLLRDNDAFVGAYVPWFAVGIGTYFLWRERSTTGLIGLAIGCLIAGLFTREVGALVWAGVLFLLAELPVTRDVRAVLTWGPLRALGQWSYSTYIVHMIPLYAAMWLANGRLEGVSYAFFVGAATALATLGLSWAMYRYIEKPGMDLGRLASVGLLRPAA